MGFSKTLEGFWNFFFVAGEVLGLCGSGALWVFSKISNEQGVPLLKKVGGWFLKKVGGWFLKKVGGLAS